MKKSIKVVEAKEPWSEFTLANGMVVRTRATLLHALQVFESDGKPKIGKDGKPEFEMQVQTTWTVEPKE